MLGFTSGNIKINSTPNLDPLGFDRPCSNPNDCDDSLSCVNCEEVCEFDSSKDGRFLYKRLLGGNKDDWNRFNAQGQHYGKHSNISQFKCCNGTPQKIKCPDKSPTFKNEEESWCEKFCKGDISNQNKDTQERCKKCGIKVDKDSKLDKIYS